MLLAHRGQCYLVMALAAGIHKPKAQWPFQGKDGVWKPSVSQDSLQARKDVTDIPLPSSQCSLEFDKLRDNPSPFSPDK